MALSKLQQFILEECLEHGGQCSRLIVDKNYESSKSQAKEEHYKKIITQSIERLIDRGLLVGYGTKTKEKLFITKIRLTPSGRRTTQQLRKSRQKKLPLRRIRKKNTSS